MTTTAPVTPYEIRSIVYHVPSASQPGTTHLVSVADTGWMCSCRDFQYRGHQRPCRHIRTAREGLAGKPVVRVHPFTMAAALAPSGNPSAWLWDPEA